jgi:hypothetical protein
MCHVEGEKSDLTREHARGRWPLDWTSVLDGGQALDPPRRGRFHSLAKLPAPVCRPPREVRTSALRDERPRVDLRLLRRTDFLDELERVTLRPGLSAVTQFSPPVAIEISPPSDRKEGDDGIG